MRQWCGIGGECLGEHGFLCCSLLFLAVYRKHGGRGRRESTWSYPCGNRSRRCRSVRDRPAARGGGARRAACRPRSEFGGGKGAFGNVLWPWNEPPDKRLGLIPFSQLALRK